MLELFVRERGEWSTPRFVVFTSYLQTIQIQFLLEGEEKRGTYRVLVGKPEGKTPLGRLRSRWGDNINCVFKKWDGRHGLDLLDSE